MQNEQYLTKRGGETKGRLCMGKQALFRGFLGVLSLSVAFVQSYKYFWADAEGKFEGGEEGEFISKNIIKIK